jgi:hypothetical protein
LKAKSGIRIEWSLSMSTRPGVSEGKLEFLEEMLRKNPNVTLETVNQAWSDSGHEGTISQSYLGKVKANLGLTRPRGGSRSQGGPSERPQAEPAPKRSWTAKSPSASGEARTRGEGPAAPAPVPRPAEPAVSKTEDRNQVLEGLEAEIDRLLFRVMELGGLEEVEQGLRRVRRLVSREIL